MRKTVVIILMLVYLAFTAGVTIQRHYCMNRLASMRFSTKPEDRCGYCGMEKTERGNTCCHDENTVYKITDDQQPVSQVQLWAVSAVRDLHASVPLCMASFQANSFSLNAYLHDPPRTPSVPLFISFEVFRI